MGFWRGWRPAEAFSGYGGHLVLRGPHCLPTIPSKRPRHGREAGGRKRTAHAPFPGSLLTGARRAEHWTRLALEERSSGKWLQHSCPLGLVTGELQLDSSALCL